MMLRPALSLAFVLIATSTLATKSHASKATIVVENQVRGTSELKVSVCVASATILFGVKACLPSQTIEAGCEQIFELSATDPLAVQVFKANGQLVPHSLSVMVEGAGLKPCFIRSTDEENVFGLTRWLLPEDLGEHLNANRIIVRIDEDSMMGVFGRVEYQTEDLKSVAILDVAAIDNFCAKPLASLSKREGVSRYDGTLPPGHLALTGIWNFVGDSFIASRLYDKNGEIAPAEFCAALIQEKADAHAELGNLMSSKFSELSQTAVLSNYVSIVGFFGSQMLMAFALHNDHPILGALSFAHSFVFLRTIRQLPDELAASSLARDASIGELEMHVGVLGEQHRSENLKMVFKAASLLPWAAWFWWQLVHIPTFHD